MLKRFDFKCNECNHIDEYWTTSSENPACGQCGATTKRIISPVSTKFNGWGWPDHDDKWARDHEKAANK